MLQYSSKKLKSGLWFFYQYYIKQYFFRYFSSYLNTIFLSICTKLNKKQIFDELETKSFVNNWTTAVEFWIYNKSRESTAFTLHSRLKNGNLILQRDLFFIWKRHYTRWQMQEFNYNTQCVNQIWCIFDQA